jgi:hypothetical protein
MGYPYNKLIAPAILLMNPGVNRDKFIELLDHTHSTFFHEYKPEEPWDHYEKNWEDKKYHDGVEGLAEILCLDYSDQYKKLKGPKSLISGERKDRNDSLKDELMKK